MSEETRRAPAAFAWSDATGAVTARGEGVAAIDDDRLTVGSVAVEFLDADTLAAEDYVIAIGCWPGGTLKLHQLGRRFDTFVAELRGARNQARVKGLLAHGIEPPVVFPGAVLGDSSAMPVDCQVYATHVTFVPIEGDPWQIPHGAVTALELPDEPPGVDFVTPNGRTPVGLLARRRDEFHRTVSARREAQAKLLAQLTGVNGFADGLGVERSRLPLFDRMIEHWTVPERAECARTILEAVSGGEPRFGFVQLLDPDGDAAGTLADLPEGWATFLLAPAGKRTVLEILAGPSAATYVFESPIGEVNRDLQLLHFRRGALALSGKDAEPAPGNPYRLALRCLAPLKRLREVTRARVIHNSGWREGVLEAVRT
jgi:hypothetical protein